MTAPPIQLAAIPQPAFLHGPDGGIVEANDRAEALAGRPLAGRTAATMVGIFDIRGPDGTPLMAADLPSAQALAGVEAVDVPLVVTAADGRAVHVLASASPIREGERVVGALAVWQDVSRLVRDQAEAATVAEEIGMQGEELRQQGDELVRTCNELERQQRLLDGVLGALPHQVSVWDRDDRLVWANARFAAERGLPCEALIGRTWREVWGDAPMAGRLAEEGSRAMAADAPFPLDFDVAGPEGQSWRACPFVPIFGDSRLVITEDVTERRRVEGALRESEAKYRRLVDEDISGDFISAADGRILDCNPAFARMFGFASVDEARSSNMVETYISRGEREALLDRLQRERRVEHDERFRRRRDGMTLHVVENIIGDFDDTGTLVGTRGYVSDDTQRYRVEEALREREQTLEGIFRAAPVGIGMVSHHGIAQANDQLCRMTGYAREELVGQDARLLSLDDGAYMDVEREMHARIMADGTGAVETQWRTKDGTVLDILLSSSPIDLARPHENIILNALDITKLRETERTAASFMDDLQRSNEELQRFAYVASHDLQEPLRSIISFTQLLERRYRGKLDSDADEFIAFIIDGGNRMQRLIEDLLQLSRVETKARALAPTEAAEVVADALRLMETPIREAGATVEVGDLPTVMADAAQLVQVFTNLVGNALKYRRPSVPPVVRISAERSGEFWRFAVEDNGIGIEAEYFDRIFVIFQRLHTREEYAGTGIGLAVARKIVERHGGRIGVESTPGEGSTFHFTLPAA